ncbi:MAG: TetR/AcrR family transcriptional regulator [Alphaproteobacteria bacterium]|nr:TetR/AcrR family transcriptional regulator [Alphaproteobacteria bacterium]
MTKLRRRLSPEVRRELILDETARLVVQGGVSAVSMERLGRDAGISKALVYNYFPNRTDLLSELLKREIRQFQQEGRAAVEASTSFEDMVRRTSRAYLEHVKARGVLIQRLMHEPSVAASISDIDSRDRTITTRFLAKQISKKYDIPSDIAAITTELLMGVTGAAGEILDRTGEDIERLENFVMTILFAALPKIAKSQDLLRARPGAVKLSPRRSSPGGAPGKPGNSGDVSR